MKRSKPLIFFGWLIVLGSLYLIFHQIIQNQLNPNTQPQTLIKNNIRQIILKPNINHSYKVNGFINHKPAVFLIDTGATQVSIPLNKAKFYGLSKGWQGTASTANGITTTFNTVISNLNIGGIHLHQISATLTPGMNHSKTILLGMNVLKKLSFSIQNGGLVLRYITSMTHPQNPIKTNKNLIVEKKNKYLLQYTVYL